MPREEKESFLPNHKKLSDNELSQLPENPLTECRMFTATMEAKLSNLNIDIRDAIKKLKPQGSVVAINCNFGHVALPGWESSLKTKPKTQKKKKDGKKKRKLQGDGTSFNSALEPVVNYTGDAYDKANKQYFLKCFTTTGQTQVPGTVKPDLSDGKKVLELWVNFLNRSKFGVRDEKKNSKKIRILWARPNMINYKFRVKRNTPRALVNLSALASYFYILEETCLCLSDLKESKDPDVPSIAATTEKMINEKLPGIVVVIPPAPIGKTKPPVEDVKLTFCMCFDSRKVRVNIFQKGKINILGADSTEHGLAIYEFLDKLFRENWCTLIRLQPRSDAEKHRMAKAAKLKPPAKKINFTLTDEEVNSIMKDILAGAKEQKKEENTQEEHKVPLLSSTVLESILAMADEMSGASKTSQNFLRNKIVSQNEEEHEENSLNDLPRRRGVPAVNRRLTKNRKHIVHKNIADDQEENKEKDD